MGERLNIEIIKNGETLANCYYHWAGYSNSSVELAKTIIQNIDKVKCDNDVLTAIRLLESTGAGLTDREIEYAKTVDELKDIKFEETAGRNEGLIGISPNEIDNTRTWQEHSLYIYLDENRMSFKVYFTNDRWEWEYNNKEEGIEIKFDDLEVTDINFDDIKFDKIDSFEEFVSKHLENNFITKFDRWIVYSMVY